MQTQINQEYIEFVKALRTIYHYRSKRDNSYGNHFNEDVGSVIDMLLEIASRPQTCSCYKNK